MVKQGIMHSGAHLALEFEEYLEFNIQNGVWVEAKPDLYNDLKIENK